MTSWTPHNVPFGSGFAVRFVDRGAGVPAYVGASPDEWTQGGGGWEQGGGGGSPSGGVSQTMILTLQANVAALKNQVDGIIAYMDPDTDAASQQAVKTLQANCNALAAAVASLASGTTNVLVNYPVQLIQYQGLKAELDSYGLENTTPPEPPNPSQGKPAATPGTTTVVQPPATPDAPVIKTNAPESEGPGALGWTVLGGALLFALAAVFFSWKAGQ